MRYICVWGLGFPLINTCIQFIMQPVRSRIIRSVNNLMDHLLNNYNNNNNNNNHHHNYKAVKIFPFQNSDYQTHYLEKN